MHTELRDAVERILHTYNEEKEKNGRMECKLYDLEERVCSMEEELKAKRLAESRKLTQASDKLTGRGDGAHWGTGQIGILNF